MDWISDKRPRAGGPGAGADCSVGSGPAGLLLYTPASLWPLRVYAILHFAYCVSCMYVWEGKTKEAGKAEGVGYWGMGKAFIRQICVFI